MSNSIQQLQQKLSVHVPPAAASVLVDWIIDEGVHIRITGSRKSKSGDYRPPMNGHSHRITVNHDLNPYEFLVTLVHEFAHLTTTKKFFRRKMTWHQIPPHGLEWKEEFKTLMQPFFELRIFPEDLHHALMRYMQNPAASGCSDHALQKAFRRYDKNDGAPVTLLEELPDESVFALDNKKVFRKIKKMRKHYLCKEVSTGRMFSVSALAEVRLIEETKNDTPPEKSFMESLFNSF